MFIKVFPFNFLLCRLILLVFIILSIVLFYKTMKGNHYDPKQSYSIYVSDHVSKRYQNDVSTSEILNFIHNSNKEELIQNSDTFGAITEETIILVILLDKLSNGFKFVISSLAQVRGIDEVLVIFSHSYFDENLNKAIRSIDYCRVLQIYYPYSIQTHPAAFPGLDPSDCPYDSSFKNPGFNCTGSLFLDVRGHFRNPPIAEKKHHWWWAANKIFENLSSTAKHTGLVIFSEDNFIFMKDFIYMASYLKNIADSLPQCEFLSLGSDNMCGARNLEAEELYSVELTSWHPNKHSRIVAFDMSVWNSIVSHYDVFCTLDDASWLHSLYYISVHRRDGLSFKTISAVTPRAYKIDSCSSEFDGFWNRCSLIENVLSVVNLEKCNDEHLFPPYLELYIDIELEDEDDIIFDYSESEGGWADPRDWGLCRNMTGGKMKKILMEMRNEFHEYFGGKS